MVEINFAFDNFWNSEVLFEGLNFYNKLIERLIYIFMFIEIYRYKQEKKLLLCTIHILTTKPYKSVLSFTFIIFLI